jgi:hypothetical protein
MNNQEIPGASSAYEDEKGFAPSVYISYRAEDNERIVRSIRDWFMLRLSPMNVVIDVDIPPFAESVDAYIRNYMRDCDIFVPIVGPEWLQLLHMYMESGEEDKARVEARIAIEETLAIAPVYIAGASPLREIDLPPDLSLVATNTYSVLQTGGNFEENMQAVIHNLYVTEQQHDEMLDRIDVDVHYSQFERALAEERLADAIMYLEDIYQYGVIPRPFRLQIAQRIKTLRKRLQIRDGSPIYERIRQLIEYDPIEATEKLSHFIARYPEVGDPDNLMAQVRYQSSPARVLLDAVSSPETTSSQRLSAGRELNEHGDPRPGVGLRKDGLPDIPWAKIPAGDFIFGFDRRIDLNEYYIARYTVTNAQFEAFINDNGFSDARWWEGLAVQEDGPEEIRWEQPNYPRVRVSWYGAVAFCRWLSAQLGFTIRLPTEEEWEKAARGPNGAIYPWGSSYIAGYSNINEAISGISSTHLREPCAVGMFPHAQSTYGVHDMIGNVWEWCLNDFRNPTHIELGGDGLRAMRGGSWSNDRLFAHTARRQGKEPTTRFNEIGFRIVAEQLPDISFD